MPIVTRGIADGAVTAAKLGADVSSLTTVDDSTIELSNDTLQVKADGIDSAHIAAGAIDTEHIAAAQVVGSHLATGIFRVSLVDGQDETSGPDLTYTLTGAADGDEVIAVVHLSTKASIATAAILTGYTITGANELTSGSAVDLSDDQLMVFWIDKTLE